MSNTFLYYYGKYFILASALVGFLYFKKLRMADAYWLPVYLLVIFIGEYAGYKFETNSIYTYFLMPFQICFFIFFIGWKGLINKKLTILLFLLFVSTYVIEIAVSNPDTVVSLKSFSVGGILLLILPMLYFIKLSKGNLVLQFYRDIFFWICISIAVYYALAFPFYTYYNTLYATDKSFFLGYHKVVLNCSVIMYILFSVGIICSKPSLKY